ncbi:protein phosphatase 2C domain-containing protein [Geomonas sp. Red32]|uniref:PP2C family protein-serine/threonine phosphatase n=1 Tax=Geomonas sp. Red32 TaxID=2912856 RepID=UPI00202CDE91|nr:protein phosphatase 2C domain-containing protein [Geomonas sp. Red32]MCM0083741.1 protein phosphatase 2C domain-containing protein [Geomonas sp. Red32]
MPTATVSAQKSDPGLLRQNNEDCVFSDDRLGLYLLADGIGRHNAGETASSLAIETVAAIMLPALAAAVDDALGSLMKGAVQAAHGAIKGRAEASPALAGMGTTLVIAVVREGTAYILSVGDSRAYRFSSCPGSFPEGTLAQIACDQTVGDELLSSGLDRELIAERHFHTLTQAVGCGEPPVPELKTVSLDGHDTLLLCSDGLTDMVTDDDLQELLSSHVGTLEALADRLVSAANARGGRDNVSVVLVRIAQGRTA